MSTYDSVYESQPAEHGGPVANLSGEIPGDLRGTLLRNGPGLLQVGADPVNFFDGHALLAGVTFADGRATWRSRFVRTPLYEAETAKGRMVQRRIFTNLPSRWSNLFAIDAGNSAMHDVYAWGDGDDLRVVAGNDPGHFAVDPRTLATRGPERWGGAAPKGHDLSPMPYRDPASGRLVGWVKKVGGLRPDALRFVEVDGAFRVVKETPWHALAASPVIVHDHRATARWYVAVEQAARLSPARAIWGAGTIYDAFVAPPGSTATLLLVPRDGGGAMVRVPLPGIEVAFHVINAWDDGDAVVVDLVTYGGRIAFEAIAPPALRDRLGVAVRPGPAPTPTRFRVEAGRLVDAKPLGSLRADLPEIADDRMGRPYRFAYFPTVTAEDAPDPASFLYADAVARLDVDTGEARVWRSGALVSQPAFVARPDATAEDDGWLLAWVARPGSTSVVVLDARDVERGPVAELDLGARLPGVAHTRWAPGVTLD